MFAYLLDNQWKYSVLLLMLLVSVGKNPLWNSTLTQLTYQNGKLSQKLETSWPGEIPGESVHRVN